MRRRRLAIAAFVFGCALLLGLLILWSARFRIAGGIVDRRLAAAGVPARYRITHIGPFLERMENVRIGDPAAPDLVAKRIDVWLDYHLSGPFVRAIDMDGVRLRASADSQGLHFGALDRLLPKSSGGKTALPDLQLSLHDVRILLGTPYGALTAALSGQGNPAHDFASRARVDAPSLRFASCRVSGAAATLDLKVQGGRPNATGPVRLNRLACPDLTLGAGEVNFAGNTDAAFERIAAGGRLSGFAGEAGPARFASLAGRAEISGPTRDLRAKANLVVHRVSLPEAARQIAGSGKALSGTPMAETGARATGVLARLLREADAQVDLRATFVGGDATVGLSQAVLTGADGSYVRALAHDGITWSAEGWRVDANVTSGGALPLMSVQLRQSATHAPISGLARLKPYRAGSAQFGASPIRFRWDGSRASFDTVLQIDGPVSGGFVRGLTVPAHGYATSQGAVVMGRGCQPLGFAQLRLASFSFDPARLSICGDPLLVRSASGIRLVAAVPSVRLTVRTADGAAIALAASNLHLTQGGFAVRDVSAKLGATHLAAATLDGSFASMAGHFAGMAGAIGNVPLNITDATGTWRLDNAVLALSGTLKVSDAAAAARFNPLMTNDARLTLKDSRIAATATLSEPASQIKIADVALEHDLAQGTGHALLDVPGISFAPKGLQPEKLTPLTLGVVANVAGTVTGEGRIDWGAQGVTSSGTFGTERTDLAAAFGPVTGIKGQIHFTDLLGLVSAPHQEATVAEINPGVAVSNGVVHYQLTGNSRLQVEDAAWPFAGGTLRLDPTLLDFDEHAERHLTFRVEKLDAAAFIQQLDFPNISATGTFDGVLPMIFDHNGGRIEAGYIRARPGGGSLAYVGELTNAELGTMGKLAFDALKAIRYSALDISLDGRLDGEMISRVRFTGVREATPGQSLVTRMIRNLPFRFNIAIRAPFRGLVGSARAYIDPRLLLTPEQLRSITPAEGTVQPPASGSMR